MSDSPTPQSAVKTLTEADLELLVPTFKAAGADRSLKLSEVIRLAQKAMGADEALREAADLRKEVDSYRSDAEVARKQRTLASKVKDATLPIADREEAYVQWAILNGSSEQEARTMLARYKEAAQSESSPSGGGEGLPQEYRDAIAELRMATGEARKLGYNSLTEAIRGMDAARKVQKDMVDSQERAWFNHVVSQNEFYKKLQSTSAWSRIDKNLWDEYSAAKSAFRGAPTEKTIQDVLTKVKSDLDALTSATAPAVTPPAEEVTNAYGFVGGGVPTGLLTSKISSTEIPDVSKIATGEITPKDYLTAALSQSAI